MNNHHPKLEKIIVVVFLFFTTTLYSQTNQWTWVSGSNLTDQPGVYGTKGIPSSSNYPGSRVSPATWTDKDGNFWLFGGNGYASVGNGYLNDLWKYSPVTNQWTWIGGSNLPYQTSVYETIGIPSSTTYPGGRERAGSWTDKNGNLWLFGGNGGNPDFTAFFNDLWKYNPLTNQWTWIHGNNYINGSGNYGIQGIPSPANTPGSRRIFVRWTDEEGNFWLFGGLGNSLFGSGYLGDLWRFNPVSNQWTWMKGTQELNSLGVYGTIGTPSPLNFPSGRAGAVSWTDSTGNLWLFGGDGYAVSRISIFGYSSGYLNDLWKYNIIDNNWTWIKGANANNEPGSYGTIGMPSNTNTPGARNAMSGWTDSKGNLWLFGGNATSGSVMEYNDLWEFNTTSNNWTWVNGSNSPNAAIDYGIKGTTSMSNTPGARNSAGNWTDNNGNIWLYGGSFGPNRSLLTDLWKLTPPIINDSPIVSIIKPIDNTIVPAGTLITLEAIANDPDGTITKVEFYNGSTKFSEDLTEPYIVSSNEAEPGSYLLTAKAFDNSGARTVSDTVRITVTSCPPPSGTILAEGFTNIPGSTVADLTSNPAYPNNPTISVQLNIFEYRNAGTEYGGRLRGYICAPITGEYTFYISGDDQAGLFLSTDDNPDNKILIAYTETWTIFRQWNKFPTQISAKIKLIKGARYYIEALHKQNAYGNHLSVAWRLPNGVFEGPMPGSRLSPVQIHVPPGSKSANNFSMVMTEMDKLTVSAIPNPSNSTFNISSIAESNQLMTITVADVRGRIIEQHKSVIPNSSIQIGNKLTPGMYLLEVIQGTERKILKLIKQ